MPLPIRPFVTAGDALASALTKPENAGLARRMARCSCGRLNASDEPLAGFKELPFFEDRGEGSSAATEVCKCGYHKVAHEPERRALTSSICAEFTPRGPHEFDSFYCGHAGWE